MAKLLPYVRVLRKMREAHKETITIEQMNHAKLGQEFNRKRNKAGMSLREAANALGISEAHLEALETGVLKSNLRMQMDMLQLYEPIE